MSPTLSMHKPWPNAYIYLNQLIGIKTSLHTMQKEFESTSFFNEKPKHLNQEVKPLEEVKQPNSVSSNCSYDWEPIQQNELFMEDTNGKDAFHYAPITESNNQKNYHLVQSTCTQTDLPNEEESKVFIDTLQQEILQKNTKLRQLEHENGQLVQQMVQFKKEPPIHIEKECATCSQRISQGQTNDNSESECLLTALLDQSQMECQLERKEKLYWKKEYEKIKGLISALEEELSLEKSKSVRIQHQYLQQIHEIDGLKHYIETECQQLIQQDESEKEELRLELEKAQSQIRVLQATVNQLSSLSTSTSHVSDPLTFSPKKSLTNIQRYTTHFEQPKLPNEVSEQLEWDSYIDTAHRLEAELKELQQRKELLQSEYAKIPLTGVQHRRRKEELDTQLDSLDKEIGYIRMKLKTMNFL